MKQLSTSVQPILENRIKIDMDNPKFVIQTLEKEFKQLHFIRENESVLSNDTSNRTFNESSRKKIANEYNKDIMIGDIDSIKKKNKLLEFIVLQKAKNKYMLHAEATKYNKELI